MGKASRNKQNRRPFEPLVTRGMADGISDALRDDAGFEPVGSCYLYAKMGKRALADVMGAPLDITIGSAYFPIGGGDVLDYQAGHRLADIYEFHAWLTGADGRIIDLTTRHIKSACQMFGMPCTVDYPDWLEFPKDRAPMGVRYVRDPEIEAAVTRLFTEGA